MYVAQMSIKNRKGSAIVQATQEKLVMTVSEMATLLGISRPTAYDLTERADFTALIRIGKRKLILRHKLMEWLENEAKQENGGAGA